MQRKRRIWLAKIGLIDRDQVRLFAVHEEFPKAIVAALNPDRRQTYYGRIWRPSQPVVDESSNLLFCKLGWAKPAQAEEVDYIESEHDWVTLHAPAKTGNYSHFVVNLTSQLVAYEERGDISRQAFLNALSLFVTDMGYEVEPVSDTAEFEAWLDDMDQVTRFYVTLKRPNPSYGKRARETREIAGQINAERLSVEAVSKDNVNVRDTFLEGAAETAALGNGQYKATGIKAGAKRFFDSAKRFLGRDIDVASEDSSRVILDKMADAMANMEPDPVGQEVADERGGR
ncbi:MAG: hypothetical protein WB998_10190 [Solirubrobacteraceae bacterium]